MFTHRCICVYVCVSVQTPKKNQIKIRCLENKLPQPYVKARRGLSSLGRRSANACASLPVKSILLK